ncbi:MAG: pseudouridine-5'-phosphate glycosidase [Actinobacteria bacterium]|jgi:pseudouridine-5'-phosphate glycosidase|nr:pseudouridine-5'-phosphate glycosidase [Actinomycetota bacterium]
MIHYSTEVASAKKNGSPIVALESTIISHGLPRPKNLAVALEVEEIVRSEGAAPATIAIIEGEIHVGLEANELERVANEEDFVKASIRDLAILATKRKSAATTVAATSHIAHLAGIEFFATGGLGGVHRGASESWDESADLLALANTPVLVVCAGVKSILDISATLERLETLSVPLIGYKTSKFPGFYLQDSGYSIEHRVDTPREIADIWRTRIGLGVEKSGVVVANPTPTPMELGLHERLLNEGLAQTKARGIIGKEVTPFLLEFFHLNSGGESLRVNVEIIKSNSRLAAQIAAAAR